MVHERCGRTPVEAEVATCLNHHLDKLTMMAAKGLCATGICVSARS
jgi:hypothetical protein